MFHSWKHLESSKKCSVLKNYFRTFIDVTGLFAGFQSFVIVLDISQAPHLLGISLLMFSFCNNVAICLTSLITYNLIVGGIYKEWFLYVYMYGVCLIFVSVCAYYTSCMLLFYRITMSEPDYFLYIISWTGFNNTLIIVYYLHTAWLKYNTDECIIDITI
jgi:hypothetical protein